ncbi:hypothetical protein ACTA71_002753 [Dictyostelium dimigraforme]
MKYYINNLFLILVLTITLFLSLFIEISNAIIREEYNYAVTFLGYHGNNSYPKIDTDDDYVGKESILCDQVSIVCYGDYITEINLKTNSNDMYPVYQDFTGFFNLSSITLDNFFVIPDFFSLDTNFRNPYNTFEGYKGVTSVTIFNIRSPLSPIVISPYLPSVNIYFSTTYNYQQNIDGFGKATSVILVDKSSVGGLQSISYGRSGGAVGTSFERSFELFSKNLPDLTGYTNVSKFKLDLQNQYDVLSFDNFKGYTGIDDIEITTRDLFTTTVQNYFFQGDTKTVKKLKLKIGIQRITQQLSWEKYPLLTDIELITSREFFLITTNSFQFINVPPLVSNFKLSGSNFIDIQAAFSVLTNVTNIDLSDNLITGHLPDNHNLSLTTNLNLSNNNITGSIPQSYCQIKNINFSNNNFTGLIPNCFICYMKSIENNFLGNFFTNKDSTNSYCGAIEPSMRLDNGRIYLEGKNLGFDASKIQTTPYLAWQMEIPSIRFSAVNTYPIYQLFDIYFQIPTVTLKARATQINPSITSATVYPNYTVVFEGSDFSYDKSLISINVSTYYCNIISATFTRIECIISNEIEVTSSNSEILIIDNPILTTNVMATTDNTLVLGINMKTYIAVKNLAGWQTLGAHITIDYDPNLPDGTLTTIIQCQNDCSGHGLCISSTGLCYCDPGFGNSDCSTVVPTLSCPTNDTNLICSGLGTCNPNSGECACNTNSVGLNCAGTQCPVSDCSGHGYCDTTKGRCNCDSSHQGLGCEMDLISCPTSNKAICSGSGTCNNQTGVCTCNQSSQGFDCSLALVSCPIYNSLPCNGGSNVCNNQTGVCTCSGNRIGSDCSEISCPISDCSGHGYCDTGVGKCNCDSSHQGLGCEMDLISCPTSNKAICSGSGTCNNQTGVCTCNQSSQGFDCSLALVSCPIYNSLPCNGGSNVCNNQTGVCTCSGNRIGSDCSEISCPISDCSGHGYCDTGVGKCNCDSSHQGLGCEMDLVSCPTSNKAICGGSGTCNNQTGICTCSSGRAGNDCSGIACQVSDCSGHGYCDTTVGQCKCDSSHQGIGCELNYIACPIGSKNSMECSGLGSCNNQTGLCSCNLGTTYLDCSGILCSVNCLNNGVCNNDIGKCKCTANWKSDNCSTPIHYLSSIDPCTTKGGQITIYGWFSTQHIGLTVTIGGIECTNQVVGENTIVCDLAAGTGTKDVNITQNGSSFIGKNKFQYISTVFKCPKDCSGHGTCDSSIGVCTCNSEYSGFDCSSPRPPTVSSSPSTTSTTTGGETKNQEIPVSKTEINIETGAAAISNQDVNYEISIISLVELDYNGAIVKTNDLKKKWDITIDPSTTNIYQFSQPIDQVSNITYIIEEVVGSSKKYTFAGMNLEIDQGGLKISVSIKNYQYESALNTLQLRFLSSAGEVSDGEEEEEEDNHCNEHEAESDTSNIDPNLTLNYISISKNSKILSGRFINKVVSDGRPTFMSSEIVKDLSSSSTIVVGLNLPHCLDECFIDPDFSVLVSPSFESSCSDGNSKSNKKWVIPVAVVVPVVCVSLIAIGAILIYRKHRYSIRLFTMKKSFAVKQRFKLRSFK